MIFIPQIHLDDFFLLYGWLKGKYISPVKTWITTQKEEIVSSALKNIKKSTLPAIPTYYSPSSLRFDQNKTKEQQIVRVEISFLPLWEIKDNDDWRHECPPYHHKISADARYSHILDILHVPFILDFLFSHYRHHSPTFPFLWWMFPIVSYILFPKQGKY